MSDQLEIIEAWDAVGHLIWLTSVQRQTPNFVTVRSDPDPAYVATSKKAGDSYAAAMQQTKNYFRTNPNARTEIEPEFFDAIGQYCNAKTGLGLVWITTLYAPHWPNVQKRLAKTRRDCATAWDLASSLLLTGKSSPATNDAEEEYFPSYESLPNNVGRG